MPKMSLRLSAVLVAAMLLGGACGAAPADVTTPTGGVSAAFEAAKAGGLLRQMDFLGCVMTGGRTGGMYSGFLGGLSSDAIAALGVDPTEFLGAFSTAFDSLQITEVSRTGDSAVVHFSVKVTLDADRGKVRDILKRYAERQGIQMDDATIDTGIARQFGVLPASETLEHDVTVVQRGGSWHACDSSSSVTPTGGGQGASSGGITFDPAAFSCSPADALGVEVDATLPSSVTQETVNGLTWQLDSATLDFGNDVLGRPSFIPLLDGSWRFASLNLANFLCSRIPAGSEGAHTLRVVDAGGITLAEGAFTVSTSGGALAPTEAAPAAQSPPGSPAEGWQVYSDPNAGFSAEFPGLATNVSVGATGAQWMSADNLTGYVVVFADARPGAAIGVEDLGSAVLDGAIADTMRQFNATLDQSSDETADGLPARAFSAHAEGRTPETSGLTLQFRGLAVVNGYRFYLAMAAAPQLSESDVNRFLGSFRVTAPRLTPPAASPTPSPT